MQYERTYVQQFLDGLDREDAEDAEAIRNLRERVRERGEIRTRVIRMHQTGVQGEISPAVDLTGCPLTREEMRAIGNRHRLLEEIAQRSPGGRIRSIAAARWMNTSGLFKTDPENASKSLAAYMRRNPAIWEPQEPGWFRLVSWNGGPDQSQEFPAGGEHADLTMPNVGGEITENQEV